MDFCPRLPHKNAFDLVERVRGLRVPVFGKRAPRLGAGQKFGFRPGRKVFAARSKIAFSLKTSAKKRCAFSKFTKLSSTRWAILYTSIGMGVKHMAHDRCQCCVPLEITVGVRGPLSPRPPAPSGA